MRVQFKIHGHGKDLFGDGMAIWYAKERMKNGPVFGNQDYFHGLAIFIDTYSNHNGEHNVRFYLLIYFAVTNIFICKTAFFFTSYT